MVQLAAGPFSRRSDGHMGVRSPDRLLMQGPFAHEILALQYIKGPCISQHVPGRGESGPEAQSSHGTLNLQFIFTPFWAQRNELCDVDHGAHGR